jgi:hypothetical protein
MNKPRQGAVNTPSQTAGFSGQTGSVLVVAGFEITPPLSNARTGRGNPRKFDEFFLALSRLETLQF